jgi:molybdate transport system substrate-binding protein
VSLLAAAPTLADVMVVSPAMMRFGVIALGETYKQQTGTPVSVKPQSIGLIPGTVAMATPAPDIVILPPDIMDRLANENAIVPASRQPLGRMLLGLGVRAGDPHPDISTVEKLRAVLDGKTVVYTEPGRGSMEAGITDKLLHSPGFENVKRLTTTDVSGVTGLARGQGDFTIQAVSAIRGEKGLELVAPLPRELAAHIDMEIAVLARSPDAAGARAFLRYMTRPEAAAEWEKTGLER